MTARALAHVAALIALAAFYSVSAVVALHPQVSEHFRDYYIRRATTDWRVVRGTAGLADGFEFASTVYPQDVEYVRGLSGREPWGRWSDANLDRSVSIRLWEPLSGPLCVDIRFRAAAPQVGAPVMIRLGDFRTTVIPSDSESHDYRFEVPLTKPATSIDLEPSRPAPGGSSDSRRVAIGLIYLRVRHGGCAS